MRLQFSRSEQEQCQTEKIQSISDLWLFQGNRQWVVSWKWGCKIKFSGEWKGSWCHM